MNDTIIFGGPGTGKTCRLSEIYVQLLKEGVENSEIAVVAFNVSAADLCAKRISKQTGFTKEYLRWNWVATFHGFCRRLLKTEFDVNVLPPWEAAREYAKFVYGSQESGLSKQELGALSMLIQLFEIHRDGNRKEDFWWFFRNSICTISKHNKRLYKRAYSLFCKCNFPESYVSFCEERKMQSPLLLTFSELITEVLRNIHRFRGRFEYILLDEVQDISPAMWDIVKSMKATKILIGDPDQSIYGFRNVNPSLFLSLPFKKEFLNISRRLGDGYYKKLERGLSLLIKNRTCRDVFGVGSQIQVHNYIPKKIEEGVVLARTNAMLRKYSKILVHRLIPHWLEEFSFFVTKTENPMEKKYRTLLVFLESKNQEQFVNRLSRCVNIAGYANLSWQQKATAIQEKHRDWIDLFNATLHRSMKEKLGILSRNKEFRQQAHQLMQVSDLDQFILDIHHPRVTLSTIHRFKGGEHDNIFIIGFKNGLFPLKRGDFQEEVRVCYVALSRVKRNLYIDGNSPFRRKFLT